MITWQKREFLGLAVSVNTQVYLEGVVGGELEAELASRLEVRTLCLVLNSSTMSTEPHRDL